MRDFVGVFLMYIIYYLYEKKGNCEVYLEIIMIF